MLQSDVPWPDSHNNQQMRTGRLAVDDNMETKDDSAEDHQPVSVEPKPNSRNAEGAPLSRSRYWKWATTIFFFFLRQWLVIGLAIACVLASSFPSDYSWRDHHCWLKLMYFADIAATGGVIKSQYSILYGAVILIFFISGLQVTTEKLVKHSTSWRLHVITQAMSFLIIPGIILGLVKIIIAGGGVDHGIDVSMLVGLIATSALPTTIASNVVFTRAAGGDDAVAMVEVMIGNILGPVITPGLCLALLPKDAVFSPYLPAESSGLTALYRAVFKQVGLSVLLPLAVGQAVQWLFPTQSRKAVVDFHLSKISTVCLILLVW